MRAYEVIVAGIRARYRAATRGRALYLAVRAASDAGFGTVGELFKTARAIRAPELDVWALCGAEGYIPEVGRE